MPLLTVCRRGLQSATCGRGRCRMAAAPRTRSFRREPAKPRKPQLSSPPPTIQGRDPNMPWDQVDLIQNTLTAIYVAILLVVAVYGLHRYVLVYLYVKYRNDGYQPKG